MGMAVEGGSQGSGNMSAEPNVVPMIDILLVLLIIFMIMQPMLRKAIDLQLPDPTPQVAPANANVNQIVLEVRPGPAYAINTQPVDGSQLEARLKEIYATRPRKVIFVKGDENIAYGDVVHVVDASRAAGVEIVGLVPRPEVGPATVAAPAP